MISIKKETDLISYTLDYMLFLCSTLNAVEGKCYSCSPNKEHCSFTMYLESKIQDVEAFSLSFSAITDTTRYFDNEIDLWYRSNKMGEITIINNNYEYSDSQRRILETMLEESEMYHYYLDAYKWYNRQSAIERISDYLNSDVIEWERQENEEIPIESNLVAVRKVYRATYGDAIFEYSEIEDDSIFDEIVPSEDDPLSFNIYSLMYKNLKITVGNYFINDIYQLTDFEVSSIREKREEELTHTTNYDTVLVRTSNAKCEFKDHRLVSVQTSVSVWNYSTKKETLCPVVVYYCHNCNRYYLLEKDYNKLTAKGIIRCKIIEKGSIISTNDQYAEQSILAQSGYSVSQKENLSTEERHNILNFVICNGLWGKDNVISHIEWLVRKNSEKPSMANAVRKWNEDIDYLRNGPRPDPNDFKPKAIIKNEEDPDDPDDRKK